MPFSLPSSLNVRKWLLRAALQPSANELSVSLPRLSLIPAPGLAASCPWTLKTLLPALQLLDFIQQRHFGCRTEWIVFAPATSQRFSSAPASGKPARVICLTALLNAFELPACNLPNADFDL